MGGCCTAIELAQTNQFNVILLEKNQELMRESSDATPGRLGLGFHYADKTTALHCLHVTLEFIRKFGLFRQEVGRRQSHPLRRGRYFIMKNSLVPTSEILKTYEAIKAEYSRLVCEDSSYEVFGPPEELYRILEPREYDDDVEMENIEMGIETAEEMLDWPMLRKFILCQLEQEENTLTVQTNTEAIVITTRDNGGYVIEAINTFHGGTVRITTDIIVNASWYNISKFDKILHISSAR